MRFTLILLIFLSFLAFSYEANDKEHCQSNRNLCNKRCYQYSPSSRRRCLQRCTDEYFNCLKGIF